MDDSTPAPLTSSEARQRGNALYQEGKLSEALDLYMSALQLAAEDDALPLANISAVKYEMGDYGHSLLYANKALVVLRDFRQDSASHKTLEAKLQARRAKCQDMLRKPDHLAEAARVRIIDRLARYKPCLQPEPEYYPSGHDYAEALVKSDDPLLARPGSPGAVSFFYGGVGDARNVLANIITLGDSGQTTKQYHITMCDIKPAMFARDLIVFKLLSEGGADTASPSSLALDALCYIYAVEVMPPSIFEKLQSTISQLVSQLQRDDDCVGGLVYVPKEARAPIVRHLQIWQLPPEPWYSALHMRLRQTDLQVDKSMYRGFDDTWQPNVTLIDLDWESKRQTRTLREMLQDLASPENIAGVLGNIALLDQNPENVSEMARFQRLFSNLTSMGQLRQNFDEITVRDEGQGSKREMRKLRQVFQILSSPEEVANCLSNAIQSSPAFPPVGGTKDVLLRFFARVSTAMRLLGPRLVLEVVLGDMGQTLERLEHRVLRKDYPALGHLNPATFPSLYDRAYLSNVPDYVGGPLTVFMHGLPILRESPDSKISSYVLLNPKLWPDHDHFLSEHLLTCDRRTIRSHYHTEVSASAAHIDTNKNGHAAFLVQPIEWTRHPTTSLPFDARPSRQEAERYLYAHFLKICIPFPRPSRGVDRPLAPLNMTMLFRIVESLHETGYPAHWLTAALLSLSSGTITTTARAPRAMITSPELARRPYPPRRMSVAPFACEFNTLLAIWRPALPFCSALPPAPGRVRRFTLIFTPPPPRRGYIPFTECPHFVLVFWRSRRAGHGRQFTEDMRLWLLDDEGADRSEEAVDAREKGIHVVSAFTWLDGKASFWLDEGVMDGMVGREEERWLVFVWRTDVWLADAMDPIRLHRETEKEGLLVRGEYW